MMLSASSNTLAKSSLEEMLESLRQKDECDRPRDMPPALPSRPNSRARLPSARRSLPAKFNVCNVMEDQNGSGRIVTSAVENELERKEEGGNWKEKDLGVKRNSFGSKKMRTGVSSESPYAAEKEEEGVKITTVPVESTEEHKPEWNNNVEYFNKKSKAGPVLIAVNPFKNVKIYGNDFISAYQKKDVDAPHVYDVADAAYDEMMREEKNQSIIIRINS